MPFSYLAIENFRNLANIQLEPVEKFNIFYGKNGAGKTSLLEAIYYLAVGRSFRSNYNKKIIANWSDHSTIFARTQKDKQLTPIGISFNKSGQKRIRIAEQEVQTQSELAKITPLQLINTNSYRLIEMGPKYRRQFIDWGLFHVEPTFLPLWKKVQRTIQQRNAAIRQNASRTEIALWDQELTIPALELHKKRAEYVASFTPIFQKILEQLLPEVSLKLDYCPGWDTTKKLAELLQQNYHNDRKLGYTSLGPQKADIRFSCDNTLAQDLLSRGQQKMVVSALQLTQGIYLEEQTQTACLYLIDDLPSELDQEKQAKIFTQLQRMNSQVFITGINRADLDTTLLQHQARALFHVEQGRIIPDIP